MCDVRRAAAIALMLAAAATCAGCGGGGDASLVRASGHVSATEVRVSSKVGGRILAFPAREGDRVERGAALAQIDTVDVALALAAARGERDQAAAELRLREAGSRKEDVAEAEATVAQAAAELEGAEKDFQRAHALLDAGSGTTKARDDAATRRSVAEGRLEAARMRLARLRAGVRPEEIASARARLRSAEARVAQLEQGVADARVTSPLGGLVTEKLAEEGELVPAGSPLAVVTDLADAWLTVYVAEPDVARIRIGGEARVVTDDGQSRAGSVTFIASRAEFTPKNVQTRDERVSLVYRVKIALPNEDGLFKPGMPAEAEIQAAEASRAEGGEP